MSDYPPPPGTPNQPSSGSGDVPPPPPPPPAGTGYGTPPPPTGEAQPGYAGPPPGYGGATPAYGSAPGGAPGGYPGAPGGGRRPGELLDRFVARLIDHVLLGIVNAIITGVLVVAILGLDGGAFGYGGSFAAGAVIAVLSTAISLGYFVFMETQQGKTLGKMVMKLEVEGSSGGKPTVEESVKRNIWMALTLLGIVPFLGILGSLGQLVAVIMIAVGINSDTVRRQPWTDKFAGTQVLKNG